MWSKFSKTITFDGTGYSYKNLFFVASRQIIFKRETSWKKKNKFLLKIELSFMK